MTSGKLDQRRTLIDEDKQIDFILLQKKYKDYCSEVHLDTKYSQATSPTLWKKYPNTPQTSTDEHTRAFGSDHFALHGSFNFHPLK